MSGKYALIIANSDYSDPTLPPLTAPGKDATELERVLKSPDICAFDDVSVLLNESSSVVSEAIDDFLYQRKPDDLLFLYFSGHGTRDESGDLYLALKNTNHLRLRKTAIKSSFIHEAMAQSRSKRQVLILDCCNSGAFLQGAKSDTNEAMGLVSAFQGYGRVVLAASRATQLAWEVVEGIQNSLFTHFLVKGLEGEADSNGDGKISVDELYDYAYEQILKLTPKQTPIKSAQLEGDIVLRQITRMEDIKPLPLPPYISMAIENPDSDVRLGAVQSLIKLLHGQNLGLARSARLMLEKISNEDDSRRVSLTATQALDAIRQAEKNAQEEQRAKEPKAVEDPIAKVKIDVKQFGAEKTESGQLTAQLSDKTASSTKTVERSLLLHLVSGTGLFQIGSQSSAKWLYPLSFFLTIVSFLLSPPLDLDYKIWKADLISDGIAGAVGYISLYIYLVGFVDTWRSFGDKTLQKSLLWHLVSGRGLLYTESQTRRRWLYPPAFLLMVAGFFLCPPFDLDIRLWNFDILGDWFAALIGYVCLFIYLIGFIDTWLSLRNKSLQKSLIPQLLSGTGFFFTDSQPTRRWLYLSAFVLMIAGFSLCPPLDLDSRLWAFDLVPDLIAGVIGYLSLIVYLVGVYDIYMSSKKDGQAKIPNATSV